nr:putative DNA-directed RNA polymerase subunit 1 inactive-like protein [Megavirus caiporensis]
MVTIIDYLNHDVLLLIFDYLNHDVLLLIFDYLPDGDKISFAITNKYMSQYINCLIYTDLHQYELIRFLPFKNHFRRLSFRPRYDIIPPVITDLIIDKNFVGSLQNVIPASVKNLQIDFDIYDKNKNFIREDINISRIYPYIGYKRIMDKIDDIPYGGIFTGFNVEDGLLLNNNNLRIGQYYALERFMSKNGHIRRNMMDKRQNIKSLLEYLNSKCVPMENILWNENESCTKSQPKYYGQKNFRNKFSSPKKFHHQKNFPRQKFSKFYR